MKKKSFKESSDQLFAIAQTQGGFFTAKQAETAGFERNNHTYHVKVGNWEKACRGVYRLAHYPFVERSDLITWSLWSRGRNDIPQGVYSHQTALSIYDLSDISPSKLHMTVPSNFRRGANTPGILILHYGNLHPGDICGNEEYKVTTPIRSILDVCQNHSVEDSIIIQSISEGLARGLLSLKELEENAELLINYAPESKRFLKAA